MRKYFCLLILVFAVCVGAPAQKKKPNIVSDSERQISKTYAEGLKEFYSRNFTAAEKTFRNILEKNSKHDASYFMLGKIKSEQKDYTDAAYYFKQAASIDKTNEWYLVELAQMYDKAGNYSESAELWKKLSDMKPNIENYLISEADALVHLDRYTDVIKVYDKLEILIGYNEELTETKKNIWLYLNNVKNAVGEYDKLIAEFPTNVKNYIRAGDIYLANKQYSKALPYYEKAQKLEPNNPELQFALAEYYDATGNADESWKYMIKVIKNPDYPLDEKLPTIKNMFTEYVLSGERSGISKREMYDVITALTEAHPEAIEGWANLASLKIMDKDYAAAKTMLEKAIAIDVSRYTVWEDYFFVLAQLREDKKIIEEAERVLELFPGNSILQYSIGVAYLNTNNAKKAVEMLKSAAAFSYDTMLSAKIYYMLGNAYLELGNKDEAVSAWKTAKRKGMINNDLNEKIKKYE